MVTYFLLTGAFVLLGIRFIGLLRLKRRNLSAKDIDQHLHALMNEKRERP
ncbi:hypothetical protein ACFSO0_02220 [Brevibacillus sp. GCM10020057]